MADDRYERWRPATPYIRTLAKGAPYKQNYDYSINVHKSRSKYQELSVDCRIQEKMALRREMRGR